MRHGVVVEIEAHVGRLADFDGDALKQRKGIVRQREQSWRLLGKGLAHRYCLLFRATLTRHPRTRVRSGAAAGVADAARRWSVWDFLRRRWRGASRPDIEVRFMTIPPELEAQILRYYHVEKWRVGTIARQLHVHYGTVTRVLAQAGLPRTSPPARRSQVDPFLPFILEPFRSSRRSLPAVSTPWCASAATAAGPITSAISWPAIVRGRLRKPIYGCAPCPPSRAKSTGVTSAISPSVAPAGH